MPGKIPKIQGQQQPALPCWVVPAQQPISRVVGKRVPPPGTISWPDVFADGQTYAVRTVDVMTAAGGRAWEELAGHIQTVDLDGVPLRVLTLQGLLLTQQGPLPKERLHAAALESAIEWIKSHPR